MSEKYLKKYLKYKNKYTELKKSHLGGLATPDEKPDEHESFSLDDHQDHDHQQEQEQEQEQYQQENQEKGDPSFFQRIADLIF